MDIWSDLHSSLEFDASGELRRVYNEEAVKVSIDNIIRTRLGSRVMRPDFGSGIYDYLFSPMSTTTAQRIARNIKNSIEKWDDRVIVNSVNVSQSTDYNSIKIDIWFSIKGLLEESSMTVYV